MDFSDSNQVSQTFSRFYRVIPDLKSVVLDYYRVLPSLVRFYRVAPSFTGFYRVLLFFFLFFLLPSTDLFWRLFVNQKKKSRKICDPQKLKEGPKRYTHTPTRGFASQFVAVCVCVSVCVSVCVCVCNERNKTHRLPPSFWHQ